MRAVLYTIVTALTSTVLLAAPSPLTLDQAIDIAVRQSKQIAAARQGVLKAEAQVSEALGSALPTLNLSAVYTRNLQLPVFFIPDFSNPSSGRLSPVTVGLDNQYSVGLQASQILFNSAVFTGIGASKIYNQAAREQLVSAIASVVTETKKRFYGALLAKEVVLIAKASYENGKQNLAYIQLLFKEGLVAEFDAIRAEVGVDNIQPIVTQSETGYQNAVSALLTQMGANLSDSIEPIGSFPRDLSELPSEDQVIAKSLKDNYDIKAAELQERVSKEFIALYQGDYYPTVSAFGNWSNQGQSNAFNNWISASMAGVGLSFQMNLFNGLRSQAKVEQSQADYETVRTQVAQLRDGVKLQIRVVLNAMRSARSRFIALQRTVDQAQRGYDISQIRYREGTGSLLEINDADLALAQARTNTVQSLHDYHVSVAELDRLAGDIDRRFFATVPKE